MEFSKKINGERWSLSQNYSGQVVIKKENEVVSVQNLNYKLDTKLAFNLLSKGPTMKMHPIKTKGAETKLNKEEIKEEEMETKEIKVPKPHVCLFCNTVPEVHTSRSTDSSRECRAISCKCTKKVKSSGVSTIKNAKWIYTVDIIDGNQDEADCKLISEWNSRMPEINK